MTHSIPVSNGLLTPEHREAIGPAIWVFLWLIDHTTKEQDCNGSTDGLVYDGRPVIASDIARSLGETPKAVRQHLQRLREKEYIKAIPYPGGMLGYIVNNSKRTFKKPLPEKGLTPAQKGDNPIPKIGQPYPKKGNANKEEEQRNTKNTKNENLPGDEELTHQQCVEDWKKFHDWKNPELKFHPSGREFKALQSWLKENSDIDRGQWQTILRNRGLSPGIDYAEPFWAWADRARQLLTGPKDKYWKPVTLGGNGNGKPDKDSIIGETAISVLAERERTRRMADGENCQDAGGIPERPAPKQAGNFGVLV